mgnify:CR=1 FL=1
MKNDTINYKGCAIEIIPDQDPMNPRTEWDNLGKMICFHQRYNLGDRKHGFSDSEELQEFLNANQKTVEILPLYLYDHSGITISTGKFSGSWDSGQVGYIYIDRKTVMENWPNCKQWRKKAIEVMKQEVKTYDDYLTGNVYGFQIMDKEGNDLNSCFGFYGDPDKSGLMDEAKCSIEYHIQGQTIKHIKKLKAWIKNNVQLYEREPFTV